ncbi:cupin domain-containing protein [Pseudooceanicola onchidii]|uniref:cupin domain-containing protein n=1 Tax=Pseudooceanicola onchidii TaxID=2562279 RepID=UPI0010AACA77|nr:cupin domain-containing protein [Pseudooceanicola onchidii]
MTAEEIIALLDLQPHPEGGHYRQTWIDDGSGGRPAGTCIYFLLKVGERSQWHRVDAVEIWHHYAGAPLRLMMAETEAGPAEALVLGPDLASGARPQGIVPKDWWQAAETLGDWTLVGCTVSPGFRFEGFELAAPGFDIPRG